MQLLELLPSYYDNNKTMILLQLILSSQCDKLGDMLQETVDQCTISTASSMLQRWERIFDVPTNLSLTYKQRREALAAKIMGAGTTTKEMIKRTAAAFSGGDVEVVEDNAHSAFIIRFVGTKGIPTDMQSFIRMIEDIKPAHLSYSFEYTYTVWGVLKEKAWDSITDETWDSLQTSKEV